MSDGSLEQAIGAVLQDPQQLQKIFALAQSLGLSPPEAPAAPPPPEPLKPAHRLPNKRRRTGAARCARFCSRRASSTAGRKTFSTRSNHF